MQRSKNFMYVQECRDDVESILCFFVPSNLTHKNMLVMSGKCNDNSKL